MKIIIIFLYLVISFSATSFSQNQWKSINYNYTINRPNFLSVSKQSKGNIDVEFTNSEGTSFIINVSPRLANEYKIDLTNYTRQMVEKELKTGNSKTNLTYFEKIKVDGHPAILYHYEQSPLKAIELFLFKGNLAFMITATTSKENFDSHVHAFSSSIKSLKF